MWLTVGNEVRRAWYASGSGTANLEFTYTVERGDLDSDGVSLCSDTSLHSNCGRISLNGGTITATADDTAVPVNYPEMGVVKHALLTPRNPARSMGYRADRHRTRAPINSLTEECR